ncbi:MAG: hypothetical protein KDJ65_23420, partial [Anaerolineae bacterium]|nr:hypothetical protein [Anaerolineae bacterium]
PMGFLPLAGRPIYAQPFEISQMVYSGVWDQTPFVDSIEQQAFSTIILLRVTTPFGRLEELVWTPEMLEAIDNHYRQVELINETIAVYEPK